jgi:TolB-like protein/Tfp pilus assembly protein PilF
LKRRHIYRVAAAYAVVAWVLIQLVSNISPMLRLPDWAGTLVLVLLFVGFPVALLFAWIHQLAPEGGALAPVTTGKLDWVLIGALVVVIALVSYQQLAPAPGARIAESQQASVAAARAVASTQTGAISIAVLPFVNLSSDKEQEFFSDGMTEEITSALAQLPDLRVVARTSAFQFKNQSQDLRMVGQSLGATHLIEGSIRRAGDRIRITAQLIRADDGSHLWADNYDRELKDVFAIQEDIAQAIAGALRVPLGLKKGESLVRNATSDVNSHEQYLRAKALVRSRGGSRGAKPLADAAILLEQLVNRDPNYAPAWALLAEAYTTLPDYVSAFASGDVEELHRVVKASLPKAEAAARRAIELDPKSGDGYLNLGFTQATRFQWLAAEELYSKALMLDPDNPEGLHRYGNLLAAVGRIKDSLAMRQRLQQLEPFVPTFSANTAAILWVNGQDDAAIAMLKALPEAARAFYLAKIYAAAGRFKEAAENMQEIHSDNFPVAMVEDAVRLLRAAPAAANSPRSLPRLGELGFIYPNVGAPERLLEFHEGNVEAGYSDALNIGMLWRSSYATVRKTERFKTYARKAGLVEYWRAKGWPEFCHPTTGDNFACE